MSAQRVSDDMKETASLDAARIVREAEGRAELITQKAQAALEDIQREIDGLRLKRRESEVALESNHRSAPQHARVHARAGSARDAHHPASSAVERRAVGISETAVAVILVTAALSLISNLWSLISGFRR